jgi:hypothetical protein
MHKWIKLICLCIFFFKTVEKNRIYEYNEKRNERQSGRTDGPDACFRKQIEPGRLPEMMENLIKPA